MRPVAVVRNCFHHLGKSFNWLHSKGLKIILYAEYPEFPKAFCCFTELWPKCLYKWWSFKNLFDGKITIPISGCVCRICCFNWKYTRWRLSASLEQTNMDDFYSSSPFHPFLFLKKDTVLMCALFNLFNKLDCTCMWIVCFFLYPVFYVVCV